MAPLILVAKPYNFRYDPLKTALLIIDFQRDFLLPGGFGESLGNDTTCLYRAVLPAKKVLDAFRKYRLTVIHTRESHMPDLSDLHSSKRLRGNNAIKIGDKGPMGRILIRGEQGTGIIEELAPIKGELVIDKPGKGAFYNTQLEKYLRAKDIHFLVIVGVTTEVCVQSTVREANDRGFEPLVLEDCVASYKPTLHDAALQMITSQNGIFGWVSKSDKFIASLSGLKNK